MRLRERARAQFRQLDHALYFRELRVFWILLACGVVALVWRL